MTLAVPRGPVVLVGLMATGKTTVGQAVARALHREFFDSDRMVEAVTGKTVAELWAAGGEPAFRALETDALAAALDGADQAVIAAAGGVVLSGDNRERLRRAARRGAVVVWLRADPQLLATRVRAGDHRPLLASDPVGTLVQMGIDRAAWYAEVADVVVDVDGLSVAEAADAVLAGVASVIDRRLVGS
ncbi:MAG: shikimate kinase [Acidimicrobiales bacterium]